MTIVDDLIRDEGLRLKPYKDTVGKITIGIGRNLDDHGISEAEAMLMFYNDLDVARSEVRALVGGFPTLPEPVQRGLINMMFNLGYDRLRGFRRMLSAIERKDFKAAALEALDSRWAEQVGDRAQRIAKLFEEA